MMRLQQLRISGFGALRDRVVEIGPGITVLLGCNEAGKSTTLHCLAQVLLGKPSQRSLFPDFSPWDGGGFSAAVECLREGERFRLTRRFDESGTRAVALHRLREDGSEALLTQEAAEVRKWVAEALGTADDRIFYRIFCLTQAELSPLDQYAGLREHLERVASGAEMAVTAAVGKVDERLATLTRGVGQPALRQNWGMIKRAEEARKGWESRLQEARRQQRRLAEAREASQRLQRQITEGAARIELISALLEQDRRRRDLLARLAELRTTWATLEGERERVERLAADRERLRGLLASLPAAYADPAAVRNRLLLVERHRGAPAWVGVMMLLTSLLFSAAGVALGHWYSMVLLVIGPAAGIPILLNARHYRRQVAALCQELQVHQLGDALTPMTAAERYRRELDATELAISTVTDTGELAERRRTLAMHIATAEEQLRAIPGTALSGEEAQRLLAEQQSLRQSLPGWQEQERMLAREVAVLEESERDLVDMEDGVAYWRQEEARAREEEQTLALARELLMEAGKQAHGAIAGPLAARITPLFAAMTGGKYPRVQVAGDAKTLEMHPLDAEGTPVAPDQLSRGTRDQFILAVRLALGLVLAGPYGSPLFLLDEPLLHFDDARRREAMAMLTELSAQAQLIIATHDPAIAAGFPGARVVEL